VSVVSMLDDVVARLRDVDPRLLSGDECVELVARVATVEKVCAGLRARAAIRVSECGEHRRAGFADAADWLARTTGSTRGAAREAMTTATAMEACPVVAEAVASGDLSLTQAREIVVTELQQPGSAAGLVEVARRESVATLKGRARDIRLRAIDPQELHAKQHAAQEWRWWHDEMGMVRIAAALPPEIGMPIVHRIDTETDRRFRAARRSERSEPREVYAAEAFVAMLQSGGSKPHAFRTDVSFTIDINTYRQRHTKRGGGRIVGGGPVPTSVIDDAIDNGALVKAVLHDGVRILAIKHFTRGYKAELRTALELGDPPDFDGRACVDCGGQFRPQIDHDLALTNGGATEIANLKWRCPTCHRAKTERDLAVARLEQALRERREHRAAEATHELTHNRAPP